MSRLALAAGVLLLAALAGGCNIVTPVVYAVSPPPTKEAEVILPVDRPTLIYVDDRRNQLQFKQLRVTIADRAAQELLEEEVLTNVISARQAMQIVEQNDLHSEAMPVADIGRSVGAEIIVYVEVMGATPSFDGQTPKPALVCRLKVLDIDNETRLFPLPDPENPTMQWRTMQVIGRTMRTSTNGTNSSRLDAYRHIAEETGSALAKLFYEHSIEKLGKNLER